MQGNKTLIALVAVVVVAAGAYYMLAGSVEAPTAQNAPDSLPEATDSVDDFAAAMQADLDATASALKAFDTELQASVDGLLRAGDETNLYDPEKSNLQRVAAGLLALSMLAPTFAFAENDQKRPYPEARNKIEKRMASSTASSTRPNVGAGGQNFCQNIDRFAAEITKQLSNREDKKVEKREERSDNRDDRRGLKDGKLDDRRDDRDENRGNRYDKLYGRASTTEAKAAVDAFKTAVESAVTTRRAAVDAAIVKYRTDVDALIATKKAAVDTAWATLKSSVDAAVAKAKADCTAGVDPSTIRATLKDSMRVANDVFKTATKPSTMSDQVQALKATRDASIKSAMEAFKTAVDAALATLKTALGK